MTNNSLKSLEIDYSKFTKKLPQFVITVFCSKFRLRKFQYEIFFKFKCGESVRNDCEMTNNSLKSLEIDYSKFTKKLPQFVITVFCSKFRLRKFQYEIFFKFKCGESVRNHCEATNNCPRSLEMYYSKLQKSCPNL